MKYLVRLTLHVDAFTMVQGGAWEVLTPAGKKLTTHAFPVFAQEMTMPDTARRLAELADEHLRGQQTLF